MVIDAGDDQQLRTNDDVIRRDRTDVVQLCNDLMGICWSFENTFRWLIGEFLASGNGVLPVTTRIQTQAGSQTGHQRRRWRRRTTRPLGAPPPTLSA